MLLTSEITIKVGANNCSYWRNLGYSFTIPNKGRGRKVELVVKIAHLKPKSNVRVECWCERCEKFYINRYSRNLQYCSTCCNHFSSLGNTHGKVNRGKLSKLRGSSHPKFNPNRSDFLHYQNKVRWLSEKTYKENIHTLNPEGKIRALCGVDGAYQLDHIISVKKGYELNMTPEELSDISNLQLLPWKVNRDKWK